MTSYKLTGPKLVLLAPDSQQIKLQELVEQRMPLSERFKSNPNETHLALELKIIDDQIAECNKQIQGHRRKQK
jgi:hypothetical protein